MPIKIAEDVGSLELGRLRAEFDQADQFVREVQAFRKKAGIPAQNELRNVGYHLLYALTDDSEPRADQVAKAINHCKRASYEAAESGVLAALAIVNAFKVDYESKVVVSEVVRDWHDILVFCDKCSGNLSTSRKKGDDRSSDYSMHMDAFRELTAICLRLDKARDDLNLKIKSERDSARRYSVTIALSILGTAVAALFGILALWG